jgi:Lon protease-like protein
MNNEPVILGEVPIFPLPSVVLFPGALLQLHMFEPRYRRLTEEVLASNQLMCVVQHAPFTHPDEPAPALAEIAGLGEVVNFERLPDGRFNLLLRGRARMRLEELPFRPPYRRARAVSVVETLGEPTPDARKVLFSAARAELVGLQRRYPGAELELDPELELRVLVDRCAQYLVRDASTQQMLLETLDVNLRTSRCIDALLKQGISGAAN